MSIFQTPVHVIGGQGGGAFSYNAGASGRILRRIGVWAGGWYLGGIRLWWTGLDDSITYGTANSGSYREFTFEDGERITSLSLWGNGAGTRSGGIRFRTTGGREFFHYMTSWGLKQEYPIDVASGLCVGVMGRHGDHIDSLGFMFLRTIASARMINVSYPTLDLETAGIVPVTLDSMSDSNNASTVSKNWTFGGSRSVTISSSWAITAGIELHASITVTAGIPTVAEVQGEYGWSISSSSTYTTSHEETRTLSWENSGVLQPGEWISLQALTRRGTISLPYQATMQITLQNGALFTYPITALYAGVDYTNVQIVSTGTRHLDSDHVRSAGGRRLVSAISNEGSLPTAATTSVIAPPRYVHPVNIPAVPYTSVIEPVKVVATRAAPSINNDNIKQEALVATEERALVY